MLFVVVFRDPSAKTRETSFVSFLFSFVDDRLSKTMSNTALAGDVAKNIHLWTTENTKFSLFTATETSPVLLAFFPCAFTAHENKVSGRHDGLSLPRADED